MMCGACKIFCSVVDEMIVQGFLNGLMFVV